MHMGLTIKGNGSPIHCYTLRDMHRVVGQCVNLGYNCIQEKVISLVQGGLHYFIVTRHYSMD